MSRIFVSLLISVALLAPGDALRAQSQIHQRATAS